MAKCDLQVVLDQTSYPAGGKLKGHLVIEAPQPFETKAVTVDLAWRTHGKGNRDHVEVSQQTLFSGELQGTKSLPFEFTLPSGPLTYHGTLINVEWIVRGRVDVSWAIDPKAESVFGLLPGSGVSPPYVHGGTPPAFGPEQKSLGPVGKFWATAIVLALATLGLVLIVFGLRGQSYFSAIFGGIITLIVFVVAFTALKRRIAEMRVGGIGLEVNTSEPAPGEPVELALTMSPSRTINLNGISARLRGYERAVRGSGTRKTTHTEEFHNSSQTFLDGPQRISEGESRRFVTTVTIPKDAPPSFYASDNQVSWVIEVRIDIPSWPDWINTVTLGIKPARGVGRGL